MLETTWFFLWAVLWTMYFILDGFDLGVGMLLPFAAKSEEEKQVLFHSMGPFWDGNEVWLVAAGGVTFAAFPATYAVMFSGLYTALMLLLFGLIIRGVSLEFRSQVESPTWRRIWTWGVFVGSAVPALLLGVAFANIFSGLPIDGQGIFQGTLLTLLNPYGLLGGLLFVGMFLLHGLLWLQIKSRGNIHHTARRWSGWALGAVGTLLVLFLAMSAMSTELLANYLAHPVLLLVVLIPLVGLYGVHHYLETREAWKAWGSSALIIAGCTLFGLFGNYPALLPSSLSPAFDMTIHNSASSSLTLQIMLGVAVVFVPIVLGYQYWSYRTFSHALSVEDLAAEEEY